MGMKEGVGCGRPLHVWKRGDLSGELLREGRQDGLVAHGRTQRGQVRREERGETGETGETGESTEGPRLAELIKARAKNSTDAYGNDKGEADKGVISDELLRLR